MDPSDIFVPLTPTIALASSAWITSVKYRGRSLENITAMKVDINSAFHAARVVGYGLATICSVPILAFGSGLAGYADEKRRSLYGFEIVGMISSSLTIASLPLMLWLSYRKNSFLNMVLVEMFWTMTLWPLWLCTGTTALTTIDWSLHAQSQATQAFVSMAFVAFTTVFFVNALLCILVVYAHRRGNTEVLGGHIRATNFAPTPGLARLTDKHSEMKAVSGPTESQVFEPEKGVSKASLTTPTIVVSTSSRLRSQSKILIGDSSDCSSIATPPFPPNVSHHPQIQC